MENPLPMMDFSWVELQILWFLAGRPQVSRIRCDGYTLFRPIQIDPHETLREMLKEPRCRTV